MPLTETEVCRANKTWDFTINNYTNDDIEGLKRWGPEVSRLVVAREVGDCGTPHLQCRVTFKRTYRFAALKKLIPRAHIETTKAAQDSLYCMKLDSDVVIDVDNRKQGARSDLAEAIESAKNGATEQELWKNHSVAMVRYHNGILTMARKLNPPTVKSSFALADFPWTPISDWTKSHIVWGPAGVGKTQWALAHFSNPLFVTHKDDLKQLSPDHDGIVFDDMDFRHWPRTAQIHIVDQEQPRSIDVKHGVAVIPSHTKKIFTTNQTSGFIFELCCDRLDPAIERRVTVTEVSER